MILRCICLLAALVASVVADVEVTSPAPGDSITGTSITIEWKDSGSSPSITDLLSYQIFLCAGGNDAATGGNTIDLAPLVTQGDYKVGSTAQGAFSVGLGAAVENAYFLKFQSVATGGTIFNFSPRFSLPSMTGVFPAAIKSAAEAAGKGTKGPDTINNIVNAANPGAAAGGAGGAQAYTAQTGSIRYAPMPPMAVTKITAKNPKPQFPTSAYTVAKQPMPKPNAITTITATITFSTSSIENTVSLMQILARKLCTNFPRPLLLVSQLTRICKSS